MIAAEATLSTDLALLMIDPFLASNPQFAASFTSAANAVSNNPLFASPVGSIEAFAAGALLLNQQASPFFTTNIVSPVSVAGGGVSGTTGLGTTPFGGNAQLSSGFGQNSTFGFNTLGGGFAPASAGFGGNAALSAGFGSNAAVSAGFGSTIML
jgi:hypothetical protein